MARTARTASVRLFAENDAYGRRTVIGAKSLISERKLRALDRQRRRFVHRTPNGIWDPITFYHLVDALLQIEPAHNFSAGQLAAHLNESHPAIAWDAVTVGRILNDIVESLSDANGQAHAGIATSRDWSGRYYETTDSVEGRAAMFRLLEDLAIMSEALVQAQATGTRTRRMSSPLTDCPSVMMPLTEGIA